MSGSATAMSTEATAILDQVDESASLLQGASRVLAPMPGLVSFLEKQVGEAVKEGDIILILEAMKMENLIFAPRDGKVVHLPCREGERVAKGALLALVL